MTTYTYNKDSVWYYLDKDGQLQEPVAAEKLEELARQGTITPKANVLLKTGTPVNPTLLITHVRDEPEFLTQEEVETLIDLLRPRLFGLPKSAGQYLTTLLHVAAINENIEFAKFLIQNGAWANGSDSDCETPLYKAIHENRSAELIKFLVAAEIEREEKCDDDVINKEQMKTLQTMHEGFGRRFAAKLSAMMKTTFDVKLTSVDQLKYSEFIFGLENPTCFNLLQVEPLECAMILDISPSITYPMIDRMLGGNAGEWTSTYSRKPQRKPLNEGEACIIRRLTDEFLKEIEHTWKDWLKLKLNFNVVQVESNPQLIQVVPPNEMVILLCFEVACGENRGAITICFEHDFFERVQNASLHGTSDDALFEKAERKLQEVSLLLSKIRKSNNNQTSSIKAAIAKLQDNEPWM